MVINFLDCSLDTQRFELCREGEAVALEPQGFRFVADAAQAGTEPVRANAVSDSVAQIEALGAGSGRCREALLQMVEA